jgi:hypothetical protein
MRLLRPLLCTFALATIVTPAASAQARKESASPANAPAAAAPNAAPKRFSFGIDANTMEMNSAAATSQMIGARSYGMQIDAGVNFARFLFASIDLGPQFLSDKASFTQATTAGDMNSTATLMYYSGMAGARTPAVHLPILPAASLGVYGGYSKTTGKRGIDKCVDCTSEDITIAGGTFVQPTIVLGEGNMRLRMSDRYFTDAKGIKSIISLGLQFGGH